ncbi:MAG: alpha-amylase family glycosyl hydrolase, partial [Bacteroidales bacterium]|nr:alpha-amylase family glycosyl hydrolase [Bacteroidales bacterium]
LAVALTGCNPSTTKTTETITKKNVRDIIPQAVIYEVNIRQFTPEGTIKAFADHLPRLQKLGVDILWLMPIHPISVEKRKGELGSYYAVADYKKVNPEFGTLEDLKALVNQAHDLGMFVILDWVANHTGWDNPWIFSNPEWYTKNDAGEIIPPIEDWSDVADLNYDNTDMRAAMIDALKYWVEEADMDGYRCDVAAEVPVDFWNDARAALDSIKPVFMLAEAWQPDLLEEAFDVAYGWELHHHTNEIAKGERNTTHLDEYFSEYMNRYANDDIIMNFITNHDENSWNGTEYERYGEGVACMAAFTYVIPGMPLIYTGQEAGLKKRLRFFTKDTVHWNDTSLYGFYQTLGELKQENKALEAGKNRGEMTHITVDNDYVFAICRQKEENKVVGIFNLSDKQLKTTLNSKDMKGDYSNLFNNEHVSLDTTLTIDLAPWEYKVLYK